MSLIRISRGVPKFNIQIGPIDDAMDHNPAAILSVTDYFCWKNMQHPKFMWVPINEIATSWGYSPFYSVKKILDFWCIELPKFSSELPLVYVGCSAGKHRSPLSVFCWLLSLDPNPENVAKEFFGKFKEAPLDMYKNDVAKGYIPDDLPAFYKAMESGLHYQNVLKQMLKYEKITYTRNGWIL